MQIRIKTYIPVALSPVWWVIDRLYGDAIFEWLRPMIPPSITNPNLEAIITWGPLVVMALVFFVVYFNSKKIIGGMGSTHYVGRKFNLPLSSRNLKPLSNEEIAEHVSDLCAKMRAFEGGYNASIRRLWAKYPDPNGELRSSNPKLAKAYSDEWSELNEKAVATFNQEFRPPAVALRDEMHRRLGILDYDPVSHRHVVFMAALPERIQ